MPGKRNVGAGEKSTLIVTEAHVGGQYTTDQKKPNEKP